MRRMVEGCPPIESATPLRQGFALPPPLAGEEWIYERGRAVESRSTS